MGIRIVTGEDRVKAQAKIVEELGKDYEVFEGENLEISDLAGIFFGTTLFATENRKILIKDLSLNKEVFEEFAREVEKYAKTDADVILWESGIDKRLSSTKAIIKSGVKVTEFKMNEALDRRVVFDIYNIALKDGEKAVREVEKIERLQDPYMFFGLMISQAIKRLEWRPNGVKEKKILKEFSKVDIQMKSTDREPWILIKSLLLRVKTI